MNDPRQAFKQFLTPQQFAVKVRVPISAGDPAGLIAVLVDNLTELYGKARIRTGEHAVTATWEGFKLDKPGSPLLSLIQSVLIQAPEATIKVYKFEPPRRNPTKRIARERERQYFDLFMAGHPPEEGLYGFLYREGDGLESLTSSDPAPATAHSERRKSRS